MALRDENNFFSRRIADRGSDEIVFDSQDRKIQETDPKDVIWDEIVGKEEHREEGDGYKFQEPDSEAFIRDENFGKEYLGSSSTLYPTPSRFDHYRDERESEEESMWVMKALDGVTEQEGEPLSGIDETGVYKDLLQEVSQRVGAYSTEYRNVAYVDDTQNRSPDISFPSFKSSEDSVTVKGSYSTKIVAVTRRILSIGSVIPEAKILVFSSWNDVLDVLEHAFTAKDISFTRTKGGRISRVAISQFQGEKVDVKDGVKKKNIESEYEDPFLYGFDCKDPESGDAYAPFDPGGTGDDGSDSCSQACGKLEDKFFFEEGENDAGDPDRPDSVTPQFS